MKRLAIILLTAILCACSAVERRNPTNDGSSYTATVIVTATAFPTQILSETSTPVRLLYPLETPFWVSYEAGTPVPIATGYPPSNRTDYLKMDINVGKGANLWMQPFQDNYEAAIMNNQEWIKYPERIALRITGYPNPDYIFPEEVLLFQTAQDIVIAIVRDWKLMDDSVSAYQYQVEMSRSGDYWQVDWLGIKWQCQKNRGHEDWGITLCH